MRPNSAAMSCVGLRRSTRSSPSRLIVIIIWLICGADMGYAIEVMDGLKVALQFWHSDEEFPAQIRYFWDENALQYIRYETMYFAVGHLRSLLLRLLVV